MDDKELSIGLGLRAQILEQRDYVPVYKSGLTQELLQEMIKISNINEVNMATPKKKKKTTKKKKEVVEAKPKESKLKENGRAVRFSTAPWYQPGLECIVIGLGGIGSYLCYYLGRQDAELHIFDMDMYDSTNLGGQLASQNEIGLQKTEGTKRLINLFSQNPNVYPYGKYTKESVTSGIVFCCPDNMEAREVAFTNWEKFVKESKEDTPKIFIEGSMSAEDFSVRFITPDRAEEYKKYLFSDLEIPELPCNFKATSHCGAMCGGLMISGFNNYISNFNMKEDLRELPFEVRVSLSSLNFAVESFVKPKEPVEEKPMATPVKEKEKVTAVPA